MSKINEIDQFVEEKILVEYLESVMGNRFGSYAKYIIQDRAIPDVRDGLKPVQRRILYAMKAVGMVYGEPYKKSARIVGEVIGKYHPHGDSSVYDALVRMSQDFKINVPLIDMHGNNGSIDGDSAAAMRYTEARLSEASMYLLKDIEKKTVQFVPNYDDSEIEPIVLPAKFPNLLVNGSDGISAGYATNIPPHNINEVINLTIERIKNPHLTVDEAMSIMPGPDFPSAGIIEDSGDLINAYTNGRGKIIIRSKYTIEGNNIIITEIPYEVNKALLVKKIDTIATSKKIDGIIEVRDESDKEGLRIVVETRSESNPEVIINYLLKNTDLQINFSYNMVAIVDRSPRTLGVLEIIDAYIEHSKEVIRNRSYFELDKAKKRLHIVEGLIKLVGISDEVIQTIRESNGKQDSKNNIISKFGFSELQAEAIVTLQLYRLSKYDVEELMREKDNLDKEISNLEHILSSESALKKVIISELEEVNSKIVMPRRSLITDEEKMLDYNEEELIIHEDVRVIVTKDGYIKRLPLKAYQQAIQNNTEFGIKESDYIKFNSVCNTSDTILFFTSSGYFINMPVFKIPELKYKELGEYLGNIFDLTVNERIVSLYHIDRKFDDSIRVLLSTKDGKIKLILLNEILAKKYKKGICMKMLENDEMIEASIEYEQHYTVVLLTKLGYCLRYPIEDVPTSQAKALGVKSISLKPNDEVVMSRLSASYNKDELIILTNRGTLKREFIKNIDLTKRLTKPTGLLKLFKSNPYNVVKATILNVFKFKEETEINIVTDKDHLIIKGTELPKDTFENGVQIVNKAKPIDLFFTITNQEQFDKDKKELIKDYSKLIREKSVIKEVKQTSIFDFENIEGDLSTDNDKLKEDLF